MLFRQHNQSRFLMSGLVLVAALLALWGFALLPEQTVYAVANPTVTPQPPLPTCADFGGASNTSVRASIPVGTVPNGSVFCRSIGNFAQIGNQAVIDRGVLIAVDVFALTNGGLSVITFSNSIEICLQGSGELIFLDAGQFPQVPQAIASTLRDTFTCGSIPKAGKVVLVNGTPQGAAPVAGPEQTIEPVGVVTGTPGTPVATVSSNSNVEIALEGCQVTVRNIVRLRAEPNTTSRVIERLPYQMKLQATARRGNWFRVVYLDGQGWILGDYLNKAGNCG